MNKKIIAAAIAASFVAAPAIAEPTVYGKLRQSVDFVDMGTTDEVQIRDKSSRLGIKGSEDLGNGLKAIYKMEFNVKASETGSNGTGHVNGSTAITANRNQYVGLAGDFGTVLVGRHDAPNNMAWSKNNVFGDTVADLKGSNGPLEWERIDGTVAYVSPSFSGLTFAAAIVPDETTYNPTGGDGLADHYSVAAMYSNGGLYAALGHLALDVTGADVDETVLAVNYAMDAFKVGVTYEMAETGTNNDVDTLQLFGTYTMGNNVLKAQWWDMDADAVNGDADGWAIGLDHNFSKRTQAQLTYVDVDADSAAVRDAYKGSTLKDGDIFSIGLNHNF